MPTQTIEEYLSKGGLIKVIEAQEKNNSWTKKKRKPKLKDRIYIDSEILSKFSCSLCTCRGLCNSICPPVAWMVKQVEYDPPKEQQLNHDIKKDIIQDQFEPTLEEIQWPQSHSTGEIILKKYFIDRQTPKGISKQLGISIQYIYREIKKAKTIITKNLKKQV